MNAVPLGGNLIDTARVRRHDTTPCEGHLHVPTPPWIMETRKEHGKTSAKEKIKGIGEEG